MKKRLMTGVIIMALLIPMMVFAESNITGTVRDEANGKALPGANVYLEGTSYGAATDMDGAYTILNVPAGNYSIVVKFIGYETSRQDLAVDGTKPATLTFYLKSQTLELSALEVMASRATRETPVAYTDVRKEEMELRLASRDIPMVLNTTPSVYATPSGGGAGDSRVNVRGFNQRNVAIMINGVPVNDMENGWVYWSNWDGVADATSSIQMQRGLSAVNLAAPSIGGTMNIITDPTAMEKQGLFKQEAGSAGFLKTTVNYNTGLINDKFAASGTVVRKTGDGAIDKTWTDAWAYYMGLSYAANKNNRFEFFALGAPQRHGQMRYKQNIATYDHKYAEGVFSDSVLAKDDDDNGTADVFDKFVEAGRTYNENWNNVDPNYTGKQYFYMYGDKNVDRYNPNFLNEIENYYHKPQVNLNWYWTLSDKTNLSSVFYFSGGSGGGSGTFDDMIWTYSQIDGTDTTAIPSRAVDWNSTIAINDSTVNRKGMAKEAGQAVGFLRNSINRQWTLGAISKLNHQLNENMKVQLGIDWRTAEVEHSREIRDLLGGTYAVNGDYDPYSGTYSKFYNEFDRVYVPATDGSDSLDYDASLANATGKKLGDIVNYNNTNTIDWLGTFAQAEYKNALVSFYGMFGYSMVKYSLVDHFKKAENWDFSYIQATDKGEVLLESDWITAMQFKTGGLYNVSEFMEAFVNFGYVEKVPILDNIIDDVEMALAPDPTNEKFISSEVGLTYRSISGKFATKLNLYNTDWIDRNMVKAVDAAAGSSGDTDLIFLTGLNQNHKGLELEMAYQPIKLARIDIAYSYGNWIYTDDVVGTYKDVTNDTSTEYKYSIKDLRVGDMPQTIYALTTTLFPISGMTLSATYNYYDRYWSEWSPDSREFTTEEDADRAQSWQVPAYGKMDIHAAYMLPIKTGSATFRVFMHIFNVTDAIYVQDALDNSSYNSYTSDGKNHAADDAEVYIGAPRAFNAGLQINF